jgi:hypothetical protein
MVHYFAVGFIDIVKQCFATNEKGRDDKFTPDMALSIFPKRSFPKSERHGKRLTRFYVHVKISGMQGTC